MSLVDYTILEDYLSPGVSEAAQLVAERKIQQHYHLMSPKAHAQQLTEEEFVFFRLLTDITQDIEYRRDYVEVWWRRLFVPAYKSAYRDAKAYIKEPTRNKTNKRLRNLAIQKAQQAVADSRDFDPPPPKSIAGVRKALGLRKPKQLAQLIKRFERKYGSVIK